jgi:phenylacetate-CoA ligase
MDRLPTDAERHPLLTPAGQQLLDRLREHPHAPRYNHRCGDRLTRDGLRRVRAYERRLGAPRPAAPAGGVPAWVRAFARRCLGAVPFYRGRGGDHRRFAELPTCGRADLGRAPWSFVPDDRPLDGLIVYNTSGTTGHPLDVLSHPEVSSLYLPLLRAALGLHGVRLEGGAGRVAIALVCAQASTYTYASVSAFLGGAGFVKLNLNPADWRVPEDRGRFLDDCRPEIFTGDPVSLAELGGLGFSWRPKALVSTSMTLTDGLRRELAARFGCPVVDLYSLNECRLVGVGVAGGHAVIAPDCHVEVLDGDGAPCATGERGEITITCDRNPFLPLLRYRTGDRAALGSAGALPLLVGLEGRPAALFVDTAGRRVNTVDISLALRPFPLRQFTLHQAADGGLRLGVGGGAGEPAGVGDALRALFGAEARLSIEPLAGPQGGKVVQYTSDLEGGAPLWPDRRRTVDAGGERR